MHVANGRHESEWGDAMDQGSKLEDRRLPEGTQFLGVQYSRAAAAVGVLVFHAAQRNGVDFAIGARGVDLFFVISGFIMWTASSRRPVSPSAFFRARIKRIVPLYWIATVALALGGLAGLFPTLQAELTWPHFIQSLLFVPHYSPGSGQIWPVLVPGWTLNFEMFFYCCFAAGLVASPRLRLWGLSIMFLALVALGVATSPEGAIGRTFTDPFILEFIAGMWLGVATTRPSAAKPGLAASLAVAGGAALMAVPFWGGLIERLACLLAATVCLYGVICLDVQRRTPAVHTLRLVGDASYSIYLWHGIAVSIAAVVSQRLGLPLVLVIPATVAGGLLMGLASYFLLERPIGRRLGKSRTATAAEGTS